jgi:hypothetical protein
MLDEITRKTNFETKNNSVGSSRGTPDRYTQENLETEPAELDGSMSDTEPTEKIFRSLMLLENTLKANEPGYYNEVIAGDGQVLDTSIDSVGGEEHVMTTRTIEEVLGQSQTLANEKLQNFDLGTKSDSDSVDSGNYNTQALLDNE